jgi:hypothetical protein
MKDVEGKKKKKEAPKKKKEPAAAEDLYASLPTKRTEQEDGGNAFHIAVTNNDAEILSKLLSHPKAADFLSAKNLRGMTPLGLAASLGHTKLVKLVLAIIDLNTSETDSKGRSVIFNAVANCHADTVGFLVPNFIAALEGALTDRQGMKAVSLALSGASAAACATALALERAVKGSVVGKFPNEALELGLKAGNVELVKLAVVGVPHSVEKYVKILEAAAGVKSVASCRGLAELITGKFEGGVKAPVLEALEGITLADDPRDGGEARARVFAQLRTRLI